MQCDAIGLIYQLKLKFNVSQKHPQQYKNKIRSLQFYVGSLSFIIKQYNWICKNFNWKLQLLLLNSEQFGVSVNGKYESNLCE